MSNPRRIASTLPFLVLAAAGCAKDDSAGPPAASAAKPVAAVKPPPGPPRTAPLDAAAIMAAGELGLEPFTPWADAEPALLALLGPPTRIDGDRLAWAVVDSGRCTTYAVSRVAKRKFFEDAPPDEMIVNSVEVPPTQVEQGGSPESWDACVAASGVAPTAASVPTTATLTLDLRKPVGVVALDAAFAADRASLLHKKLRLRALYLNTTTTVVGDAKQHNLTLVAAKGRLNPSVMCALSDPDAPTLMQYDEVVVEGIVAEFIDQPSLKDCALLKAPRSSRKRTP